jgi:hypothetical protein
VHVVGEAEIEVGEVNLAGRGRGDALRAHGAGEDEERLDGEVDGVP